MSILQILYFILEVLVVILPVLLAVAFMTIIERKQLAAHQRRVGPNTVGYFGVLQPFADALKLILKEPVIPSQANKVLFYLSPVITLFFSLLGWAIIPFGPGLAISDFSMGVLYTLTLSSLGIYGILFAGWSSNSKYGFLGSLRSTASMISYELILSSTVIIVILLSGSFNYTSIVESQQSIWFIVPLAPIFVMFFIAILAETSRVPFDLQEAESELVAGFFVEHSSIIFVFFFLSEYSSIVLFSTITTLLFLGGYDFYVPEILIESINLFISNDKLPFFIEIICLPAFVLGIKTLIPIFIFVWARATFPRVRFDQILQFCWTGLLPPVVAAILFVVSFLYSFEIYSDLPLLAYTNTQNIDNSLIVIDLLKDLLYFL